MPPDCRFDKEWASRATAEQLALLKYKLHKQEALGAASWVRPGDPWAQHPDSEATGEIVYREPLSLVTLCSPFMFHSPKAVVPRMLQCVLLGPPSIHF